jgi:hypothetical protein
MFAFKLDKELGVSVWTTLIVRTSRVQITLEVFKSAILIV